MGLAVSSSAFAAPAFVPALAKTRVWGFEFENPLFPWGWSAVSSTSRWGCGAWYDRMASDRLEQRYFAGTLGGRFLTADPYEASGGVSSPASWNRYPYTRQDPTNRIDPSGLADFEVTGTGQMPGTAPPGGSRDAIGLAGGGKGGWDMAMVDVGDGEGRSSGSGLSFDPLAYLDKAKSFMPKVLNRIKKALSENSECRELFGNEASRAGAFNPESVLDALYSAPGVAFPTTSNVGGVQVSSAFSFLTGGADAVVWPNIVVGTSNGWPSVSIGYRVDINVSNWNYNADWGDVRTAAAVLLHEMGHIFEKLAGAGSGGTQIIDDTFSSAISQSNTILVLDKCKL